MTKWEMDSCLHIVYFLINKANIYLLLRRPLVSHSLSFEYPRLYSFATNQASSAHDIREAENLDDLFFLPLTAEAFEELQLMQDHL